MSDLENLLNRLSDVRQRLDKVGDQLHGPTPEAAETEPQPPSTNSVRRFIDASHSLVARIESEVGRIEGRL